MKKIKLREEIKNILVGVVFVAAIASLVVYGVNRMEKIDNGEIVLVNQSYMNR